MRGADGGPADRITALPAFWVGLLYDQGALDAAWDLVKDWSMADRQALRDAAPRLALNAPLPGGRTLRDIAGQVLEIARGGLKARARMDDAGRDETEYLAPLDDIAASGITHAERLLARYHGEWAGDLGRVYADESY